MIFKCENIQTVIIRRRDRGHERRYVIPVAMQQSLTTIFNSCVMKCLSCSDKEDDAAVAVCVGLQLQKTLTVFV